MSQKQTQGAPRIDLPKEATFNLKKKKKKKKQNKTDRINSVGILKSNLKSCRNQGSVQLRNELLNFSKNVQHFCVPETGGGQGGGFAGVGGNQGFEGLPHTPGLWSAMGPGLDACSEKTCQDPKLPPLADLQNLHKREAKAKAGPWLSPEGVWLQLRAHLQRPKQHISSF